MSNVNFMGVVDRDLLKRAKVLAAKAETSVNALFNAERTTKRYCFWRARAGLIPPPKSNGPRLPMDGISRACAFHPER